MEWKFKKNLEPVGSSNGFWYDLTDGGYIIPKDILTNKDQITAVYEEIYLLESFEKALKNEELLNEF